MALSATTLALPWRAPSKASSQYGRFSYDNLSLFGDSFGPFSLHPFQASSLQDGPPDVCVEGGGHIIQDEQVREWRMVEGSCERDPRPLPPREVNPSLADLRRVAAGERLPVGAIGEQ